MIRVDIKLSFVISILLSFSVVQSGFSRSRLVGLEAKNVYTLFEDGKVSLTFDVQQDSNSVGNLLRLSGGHRVLFGLVSKTNDTTRSLAIHINEMVYNIADIDYQIEEFSRIYVELNEDRLQLIVNCSKIADFNLNSKLEKSQKKTYVDIGFGETVDEDFPGNIREFSVDLPQVTSLQCAEVQVGNLSRAYRSSASESTYNQVDLDDPRNFAATLDNSISDTIENRLFYLERQFQHFRQFVHKVDSRIKAVELHQRGCVSSGRLISFGEKQQDLSSCRECQCSASGFLHCNPIGCPHLTCPHPIKANGDCCPHCGKKCYYNGVHYESGEEVWPKQCVRCRCDNGRMECKFHRPEHCPTLSCSQQETPPNQCCPVCVNQDYCAHEQNPCDSNAFCENRQYGARCTCKQGYFGNGTSCYDIDECLWNDQARAQLNGCQAGTTICINLPGTFKCDCLPGFQRLDDRNCLDVIRL
ncbi:Protein kinase C-binding protein NELL1 [Aphelenchoides besseyi]|nr:Protein kinase C-binding protein NELL1 [Aphelenchoides besseyi]KAI6201660.1 Protein kinase C-binding protein NELL1 [Aphelenchoides besseyi]